jgi:hypothetical protein
MVSMLAFRFFPAACFSLFRLFLSATTRRICLCSAVLEAVQAAMPCEETRPRWAA